jgi:eukaryotic-like serine/threonine-protein kinase
MSDALDDGTEMKIDQALLDFMRRFDAGNADDRESFLNEHPDIAPQLKALLEAADWIEDMAGPTLGELGGSTQFPNEAAAVDGESPSQQTSDQRTVARDSLVHPRYQQISIDDSTLPPQGNQSDFSLTNLPNLDNSQSILPFRFGDYVLERVLGRGGMGVVYLAFQVQLERRVAIKMIRSGCLASDDEVNRFYSEARSAASLTHPNIVTVYHCGEFDGHHFFSMDFIPGTDLAKRIGAGPMTPKEAVRYVRDVARAIDYAHQQGVVHRDLKPANVR